MNKRRRHRVSPVAAIGLLSRTQPPVFQLFLNLQRPLIDHVAEQYVVDFL